MCTSLFDEDQITNEKPEEGLESFQGEFCLSRLAELEVAEKNLELHQFVEIEKIAHNWKGFSLPYGFSILSDLAKTLETEAKAKDYMQIEKILKNAKQYLDLKKKYLKI